MLLSSHHEVYCSVEYKSTHIYLFTHETSARVLTSGTANGFALLLLLLLPVVRVLVICGCEA